MHVARCVRGFSCRKRGGVTRGLVLYERKFREAEMSDYDLELACAELYKGSLERGLGTGWRNRAEELQRTE